MENQGRMRCQGKVGVITGCTNGIGLATLRMMVDEGAEVYMLVRRVEYGQQLAKELNQKGPGKVGGVIYFDASDISTIRPAIEKAYEMGGRIDMFVNNAIGSGNLADNHTIVDTSHKSTMTLMEGILGVSAECLRVAIPLMIKNGGGSIVNNSSLTSVQADMTRTFYGIAKTAVNMLTKDCALQYGRSGIRCNAVLPGFTVGAHTLEVLPKAFVEEWLRQAPLRRLGKPEDQAKAIMFFATDDSEWITGQILEVSGGYGLGSPSFGDVVEPLK